MPRGPVDKKPDLNTKIGKYYLAKKTSKTKKEAAIKVGYSPSHVSNVENTKTYKAIEAAYKDRLLEVITMDEISAAHADNIRQDKDRGARNTAIKMAVDKIEPDKALSDDTDKVIVILKA